MNSSFILRVFLLFAFVSGITKTSAQLSANFSASPVSGCSPLIVRFTDASTGNPTQWKWDLGNGTISFLQNPSATYFAPGRYTVKLVVRNGSGADSLEKTEYVEVFPKPVVQFDVSNTTGCFPLTVQFTDASTSASGSINTWLWDFGDGNTSSEQHPTHVFTSARNFGISLQVTNSSGCVATLSKPSLIQISTGALAAFTNDNPQTCTAPVSINFQNLSTGTGTLTYEWDFGDGQTSTLVHPPHVYTRNGTYAVKLIVTSSTGCADTIIKANAVTVGTVNAAFTVSSQVCASSNVQFNNTSAPAPASVVWSFGDGNTSTDLNPVFSYASAGVYTAKLVASFGACTDSFTRTITVLPKPTADFTTADIASCKIPFTANFTQQSSNAVSYLWSFGDNAGSTAAAPAHTYTTTGEMDVKLVATASNGCKDSLIKTAYINIIRPKATISNVPDSSCIPFIKSFNLDIETAEPVVSYLWNFGDGNSATGASPVNTYSTEGVFDVSVIIVTATGCTDTAKVTRAIITNTKPTANFSATPTNTCAKNNILFTNLSTGGATRWLWDFGDSTYSTLRNPSHLYSDTGYFDVKLKIWKGGCTDSLLIPRYIHINAPIARFAIRNDCKKPFEKGFTDQSVGADEWHWDFGDGTTSTVQNPVHTYATEGTFTATLRVVNYSSGCDYTLAKAFRVLDPQAQFTASDTAVCKGMNVRFNTNLNVAEVLSLTWNFGDGSPAFTSPRTDNFADCVYNSNGSYTVQLILTDALRCRDTVTKNNYVFVSGPTAKFTPAVPGACSNSVIVFNDASTEYASHPIQQWEWNYGDNSSEVLTAPPFQHLYTGEGSYPVKLKVTDSRGCQDSTVLATDLIISKPRAGFTTVDTSSCPGKQVQFVNQSIGQSLSYRWEFGDGASSAAQNPQHVYSSDGTYTVKLFISDLFGCADSMIKSNAISITTPFSQFTMSDSVSNCPPLVVSFTNQSANVYKKRWDFGDSTYSVENNPTHFYNYPGTYFVRLTVTGFGGCTSVFERKIVIKGPEGTFSYIPLSGCNPVTVNFTATTSRRNSFVWDFNDGTTVNTNDSVISHTYTHTGKYIPKMILIDPLGCRVPVTGSDTIVVSSVDSKFGLSKSVSCDSGTISFTDSSTSVNEPVVLYQWNFDDGTTSTVQHPVHQYTNTGIYYPSLIATTQGGCSDTLKLATPVRIVASPKLDFTSTGNGCAPLSVTFNARMVVPDTSVISWQWNFANGNAASSANPATQNYPTAAQYIITMIGTNSSGCADTVSKTIEAYAIPTVSAGADFVLCNGSSQAIQATGAATYTWSPALTLSCANCDNPVTSTGSSITYTVTGVSAQGCSASDTIAVTVKDKQEITHKSADSVCRGGSKKLSVTGASSYVWTPAASLDDANSNEPTATPDTTTIYRVIGTDDMGCFNDTGYVSIKVNPIPTVDAGTDKTINVGQTVDLIPDVSDDVFQANWSPTTGLFRNFYPGVTVKPTENTEYTVEVKNRGGCTSRDRVTVYVICNGSNIFVPNTFTPNGDGNNDIFYPRGTGLFKIKGLRIYSRWGEMIFDRNNFDANNPSYGWDGTSKGKQLNADVFIYTLEVVCDNGSILTYRGNITLIK